MLIKMQKVYGIRHCMVENGHITVEQFMNEMLTYMEEAGMLPPFTSKIYMQRWRDNGY